MGSRLLLAVALLALAACDARPAAIRASPTLDPAPIPAQRLLIRSPAADILGSGDVGLAQAGASDHLTLVQAAEEAQNQPLALTEFRRWGWVDEALRSWAAPGRTAGETLLLLTRDDGARLAYGSFAAAVTASPRQPLGCPPGLAVDECAEARGADAGLAARVGPYVFRLTGSGVDLEALAALQAARIRSP